ncbi:Oidioi.mRNA.OKI2018_I69.chr1.g2163.t1.cds [Oikopleura dioica]|uniref:Oidioi.mRNA.OKI2018_I69.chr1.g2163.t1.cds n=1 Tax=Oikopleura dioica TaxID=34765 RepID=A0ABN7SQT9_OIKDI|nr:Oidioi.mRNA.OKI2018_I69.chr1.g2163.t1.cds [Oikopleura dioica]
MPLRDKFLLLTVIGLARAQFPTCPENLRAQGDSVFITRCNLEEFTIIVEPQCYNNITTEEAHDLDKWIITSYKVSEVENFDASVNATCTDEKQNGQTSYWLNGEKQENVNADYFNFQHSDCGGIELQNPEDGTDSFYEVWIAQLENEGTIITGEWNVRCVVQDEETDAATYNIDTSSDAFDSTGYINALALEIQSLESEAPRLGELQKVVVKTTASSAKVLFNETFEFRLDRCWGNNGENWQSSKFKQMVILGEETSGCPNSPIITTYSSKEFQFRTFKFPGSDTVRIQCEVKICEKGEDGCEEPDCSEGQGNSGNSGNSGNTRKKRSIGSPNEKKILLAEAFFDYDA